VSRVRQLEPWVLLAASIGALWLLLAAISGMIEEALDVRLIARPLRAAVIIAALVVWLASERSRRR
jgi:hypothetical protein